MSALRFGVIGVGWAGEQHAAAIHAHPGAELVALAGLEEDARAALAARYGVAQHVAGWEELLALDGLDAVCIAVPTFLHSPIAIAALARGLHVLCEKPMARDGSEAAAMADAARAAGRVLDVAFNHRQRGDIQALRTAIAGGRLGEPYYAKAWWLRRTGIPTRGSWFVNPALAGGGPLVDIGIHVLDYALFLLGDPRVAAVTAATYDRLGRAGWGFDAEADKTEVGGPSAFEVEDLATAFLRLEGGGTLLVEASWAAHRSAVDQFGITLYGTEGGAELTVDDMAPSGSLTLFADDHGVPAVTTLHAPRGRAHRAVLEQFVAKVASGRWDDHHGAAGVALSRVVDACYRSAAERREVRLD